MLFAFAPPDQAALAGWYQFFQNAFGIVGLATVVWGVVFGIAYFPARQRFDRKTASEAAARQRTINQLEQKRNEIAGEIEQLADNRAEMRFQELLDECTWLADRSDQLVSVLEERGIGVPNELKPRPVRLRTNRYLRDADITLPED